MLQVYCLMCILPLFDSGSVCQRTSNMQVLQGFIGQGAGDLLWRVKSLQGKPAAYLWRSFRMATPAATIGSLTCLAAATASERRTTSPIIIMAGLLRPAYCAR